MTRPWAAEREVDADEARRLIATVAPALDVSAPRAAASLEHATLTPLGAGWDNTAWLVAHDTQRLVFRFPRRLVAVSCMENELLALPMLPQLPLAITRPLFAGRMPAAANSDETWPFAGYAYLDGEVLATNEPATAAIGRELGAALKALHTLDPTPWLERGLARDPIARLDVARRLEPVTHALDLVERDGLDTRPHREALVQAIATTLPVRESLCHGDLDPRHVLVENGRVTGLIDWGDINVGHPAMDLGLAFALPEVARAAFFAAYGPIPSEVATLSRARAIMSAARVYEWALDIGDTPLAAYALSALVHSTRD